jgi:hypothetical protein
MWSKHAVFAVAPAKGLDFKKGIFNTEAHPIQKTW